MRTSKTPTEFIWRRVHSLMGLWLILFLIIHLITNSQAALWLGDDGHRFVRFVNFLEKLPFLQAIETVFIGIPFAIHIIWGVKRVLEARLNSQESDGTTPSLPYSRNRAFTWQRLTSWIILVGLIAHVVQMRFLNAPKEVQNGVETRYLVRIDIDEKLDMLAGRLQVALIGPEDIQKIQEETEWKKALASFALKKNQVIASSPTPGSAFLLMVRNTFKSPVMAVLYTIFLLATCFHAFNGFWTFLITWGVILSYRSQKAMIPVSVIGMIFLTFLGLAAIWCSY